MLAAVSLVVLDVTLPFGLFFPVIELKLLSSNDSLRSNPIESDDPDKVSLISGVPASPGEQLRDPNELDSVTDISRGASSFFEKISLKARSDILFSEATLGIVFAVGISLPVLNI